MRPLVGTADLTPHFVSFPLSAHIYIIPHLIRNSDPNILKLHTLTVCESVRKLEGERKKLEFLKWQWRWLRNRCFVVQFCCLLRRLWSSPPQPLPAINRMLGAFLFPSFQSVFVLVTTKLKLDSDS